MAAFMTTAMKKLASLAAEGEGKKKDNPRGEQLKTDMKNLRDRKKNAADPKAKQKIQDQIDEKKVAQDKARPAAASAMAKLESVAPVQEKAAGVARKEVAYPKGSKATDYPGYKTKSQLGPHGFAVTTVHHHKDGHIGTIHQRPADYRAVYHGKNKKTHTPKWHHSDALKYIVNKHQGTKKK